MMTNFLWIDLEMTGLVPADDLIMELALIVTDADLKQLVSYQVAVRHQPERLKAVLAQSPWGQSQPAAYFAPLIRACQTGSSLAAIEQTIASKIKAYFADGQKIIIAGNTIAADRAFINRYLPGLAGRLHYRMLDVSAWKVYLQARFGLNYQKQEKHRALDDIRESIDELQYYLNWFKNQ